MGKTQSRTSKRRSRDYDEFLEKEDFEKNNIKRITNMILKHELGGDKESDLVRGADSISYLEVNAPEHIKKFVVSLGKGKMERKIHWMFKRISSKKAKQIAEPFYKNAISTLESS